MLILLCNVSVIYPDNHAVRFTHIQGTSLPYHGNLVYCTTLFNGDIIGDVRLFFRSISCFSYIDSGEYHETSFVTNIVLVIVFCKSHFLHLQLLLV